MAPTNLTKRSFKLEGVSNAGVRSDAVGCRVLRFRSSRWWRWGRGDDAGSLRWVPVLVFGAKFLRQTSGIGWGLEFCRFRVTSPLASSRHSFTGASHPAVYCLGPLRRFLSCSRSSFVDPDLASPSAIRESTAGTRWSCRALSSASVGSGMMSPRGRLRIAWSGCIPPRRPHWWHPTGPPGLGHPYGPRPASRFGYAAT